MKLIVLQHETETPPGSTLEWLEQNHLNYELILTSSNQLKYPNINNFDAVIICGGTINVDEANTYPWLIPLKEFIKNCIDSQKKILGLCLGSQLIAEALGANVYPNPTWEIGWHPVTMLTERNELKMFHWHKYSFDLPQFSELIATNENCKNQGFAFKKNILAYQFHPEATLEWINSCTSDWDDRLVGQIQSKENIISHSAENLILAKKWYFNQLSQHFLR